MEKYKCPKCSAEFLQGTKFCESCGCNLGLAFTETPTCPQCGKTFPAGTVFCSEDGAKLVSPEQLIPKCVKCGTAYEDGTQFCPRDGGKVIAGALRTGMDFDNIKESTVKNIDEGKKVIAGLSQNKKLGIIGGCIAVIVLAVAALIFTTGGKSIAGEWETESRNGRHSKIVFYADGAVTIEKSTANKQTLRYEVRKGRFKDDITNKTVKYEVIIISREDNVRLGFNWDGGDSFRLGDERYMRKG